MGSCTIPPAGWTCSRALGHDGPCAASPAPADNAEVRPPYLSDRFEWAAPGDQQEDAWIVRFCDQERRDAIYIGADAEAQARAAWEQYAPGYNMYLFRLARLAASPKAPSVAIGEVDSAIAVIRAHAFRIGVPVVTIAAAPAQDAPSVAIGAGEVEPEDREEALALRLHTVSLKPGDYCYESTCADYRSGKRDERQDVQAFRRHRLRALAPASASGVDRAGALVRRVAARESWQSHYGKRWEDEAVEIVAEIEAAPASASIPADVERVRELLAALHYETLAIAVPAGSSLDIARDAVGAYFAARPSTGEKAS